MDKEQLNDLINGNFDDKDFVINRTYEDEKAAQEVSVQEQLVSAYPTNIVYWSDIGNGVYTTGFNEVIDSRDAIKIEITINRSDYPINQVAEGIKKTYQKVLQCFDV